MKKKREKIIPLLLGADLNAYSVAVAFHEAFGVKSYNMGKYKCGLTAFSRIVKMKFCSGYQSIDILLPELFSFAMGCESKPILVPCADCYVDFINKYRRELSRYYDFLVPRADLCRELTDKAKFYTLLRAHGIPYPEFVEIKNNNYDSDLKKISYPAVLKPSVSAEYWKSPFPEMKKVYYPRSSDEAGKISDRIFTSGYSESLVLQRKIKNPRVYVYTCFIEPSHKNDFGVFGRVVVEECGKTSEGNHSAIITLPEIPLTRKLYKMLSDMGYYGFANFDILERDGEFYVLELNARQGRSSDHIRCSGINIAKRLVGALYGERIEEEKLYEKDKPYREIFWHYPKRSTALSLILDEGERAIARELRRKGEDFSALEYRPDLIFNPVRRAYVDVHYNRLARALRHDFRANAEA